MKFKTFQEIKTFFEENRFSKNSSSEWFRIDGGTYRITVYRAKIVLDNENDVQQKEDQRIIYHSNGQITTEKIIRRKRRK